MGVSALCPGDVPINPARSHRVTSIHVSDVLSDSFERDVLVIGSKQSYCGALVFESPGVSLRAVIYRLSKMGSRGKNAGARCCASGCRSGSNRGWLNSFALGEPEAYFTIPIPA